MDEPTILNTCHLFADVLASSVRTRYTMSGKPKTTRIWALRAPRVPANNALKLICVDGLNSDQDVKKQVSEVKGNEIILWNVVARDQNTGAANDFEALERLRRIALADTVPTPKIPEQIPLPLAEREDDEEEA